MNPSNSTTRTGFSLIEMLVVVSIVAIVLAISFPMIGAMRRDTDASTGINTVSVAIPSARRYATDNRSFTSDLDLTTPTIVERGIFSGAAAIFTPAGEVRIARNVGDAKCQDLTSTYGGSQYLEQRGPILARNYQTAGQLPLLELNGFKDIDIDYLLLPADTGVAGINRVSGGKRGGRSIDADDPPLILPPPFAVWYNQNGILVATGWDIANGYHNEYQYVYYDGNYDSQYNALDNSPGSFRWTVSGGYNPDEFDPNSGEFDRNNWDDNEGKYVLPFEALEAVVGIFTYSKDAFHEANDRWDDGETNTSIAAPDWMQTSDNDNKARWEWMVANGEMIMFSKQTGSLIRNRDK